MVTIVSSKNSHTYSHRKKEQLWKICDNLADKNGFRRNVYWVSGEFYRGYWRHNRREGVGIHIYRNGNRYEGEWKNGRREGQGIFWIVDGGKYRSVYRGSWKNGLWHGQGLLYGDYGEMYEGFFKNGKRCGVGKQTYWCPLSKSFHVYIGEWLDDKREGIGTLKMSNGHIYEGSFVKDLKEGKGVFYYVDKCSKYEGLWRADIPICGMYSKIHNDTHLRALEVQNSKILAENIIEEAIQKNQIQFHKCHNFDDKQEVENQG
eukprot:c3679_g1_i2 orf=357-1139(-)